MRVLDLAIKDLTQLVRDWKATFFLLAMPVFFTLMFGFVFGGSEEEDTRLAVAILDEDHGRMSAHLESSLEASDVIRPVHTDVDLDEIEKKIQDGEWAAAVVVPAGYGAHLGGNNQLPLTIIADGAGLSGMAAREEIQTIAHRLAGAVQAAILSAEAYSGWTDSSADERQEYLDEALDQAVTAWTDPPLTVEVALPSVLAEEQDDKGDSGYGPNPYAHFSASMMVQFAMAGLISAATILVLERKSRALARLMTTAISRVEIILGHFIAMFLMLFAQFVLLIVFGQLVLGVAYLREPLATLMVMVPLALWTASLGLLIGVVAKNEDQVAMYALIPMMVLAALGGAMMPLEFTPPAFQAIGRLTPTAWAIDGFKNIIVRGMGVESVLLPAVILLAYAVAFFAIAAWRFKFE